MTTRKLLGGMAVGALLAATWLGVPSARAASVDRAVNVCVALRHGEALGDLERDLLTAGYSSLDAGAVTGAAVRDHCPDQKANVLAQLKQGTR